MPSEPRKRRAENAPKAGEGLEAALDGELPTIGAVLDAMAEGVWLLNRGGRVVAANRVAQRTLGWTADDLRGRHVHDLAHAGGDGDDHTSQGCPLVRPARTGETVKCEEASLPHKDGRRLAVACTASPLTLSADAPAGVLFTFHPLAAREADRRQRAIVRGSLDAILVASADGRILEFNPAAERMFGRSRAGAIGADLPDLLVPHALRRRARALLSGRRLPRSGKTPGRRVDLRGLRADGTEFPVEISLTQLQTEGATEYLAIIRDTTERVRAEETVSRLLEREREARARAEAVTKRLESVQAVTDATLLHLGMEDLMRELVGRVQVVMEVDNVAILLPTPDLRELRVYAVRGPEEEIADRVHVPIGQGFAGRIAVERKPLIVRDVAAMQVANPMLREKLRSLLGVPLLVGERFIGVMHVGTARPRAFTQDDVRLLQVVADRVALAIEQSRHAEIQRQALERVEEIADQLRVRAAELDTVIEAIPGGVFVCDEEGVIVRANGYAAALLGLPMEHVEGASIAGQHQTLHQRRLDGAPLAPEDHPLAQALRGVTRTDYRFLLRRGDIGKDIHVQCSFAPIRDAAGRITGAVAVVTDVSQLYWLERQKDEFLSIASHELKTPLTTLKILTQLIQRRLRRAGVLDLEHSARMERAINRMERLIGDLLDVSRIESGKLALRPERMDLAVLCAQVAEEQATLGERHIALRLPDHPVWVRADPDRIEQVIANLLSNALKYTPPHKPVTLSLATDDGGATIAVHDEGVGIPPDALGHLFEQFYRVPGVQVQHGSAVGLGLGLYISREIVERHGGRLWAESAVGHGSTFAFRLPLDAE